MAKVHLIGNAHLDPAWLWRWQEGYSEALATFRSALDRMKEFDDFTFTCAGAAYYSWVEETDPEMFEEIRERVREGRWIIAGGMWIQPDCNAPCGESFARQFLYSQRYFLSRFGKKATFGYNVDSFGHNAMMPQFLKNSGIERYVYMRPSVEEKDYPFDGSLFNWYSPDGSCVTAYHIPTLYSSGANEELPRAVSQKERAEKLGIPETCFYGIGNHGGGPTVAAVKNLKKLIAESENGDYVFSSPIKYFDEVSRIKHPDYCGELQHHAVGCYTAVMEIKRLNKIAEAELISAEKFVSLAESFGYKIDDACLKEAWESVMFNQFHDVMGGCSIYDTCKDAVTDYESAIHIARKVKNLALQKIAWNIDTSKGVEPLLERNHCRIWNRDELGTPITYFNPHAWPVRLPVRTKTEVMPVIEDENGSIVYHQSARCSCTNGAEKYENLFIAELPAHGWRTYWIKRNVPFDCSHSAGCLEYGDTYLENDYIRAEFDKDTGTITLLYDKKQNKSLIEKAGGEIVIDETDCDTWAHGTFRFDKEIGRFSSAKCKVSEAGPQFATLRIESYYGNSTVKKMITLYRDMPGLYISYLVTWNEKHRMLKLSFPSVFTDEGEISSIPYGTIKRIPDGKEQPMQNFVSIGSLGIVTDTRTAYDSQNGEIRVTALRSPIYADHFGQRDDICDYTSQGEHRFTIQLLPTGDADTLTRAAAELLTPPDIILGTYHRGSLPQTFEGISVEGDEVMIDVLKKSEDGDALILRAHEVSGESADVKIKLHAYKTVFNAQFRPYEIKTFRIESGSVRETNFIEE